MSFCGVCCCGHLAHEHQAYDFREVKHEFYLEPVDLRGCTIGACRCHFYHARGHAGARGGD